MRKNAVIISYLAALIFFSACRKNPSDTKPASLQEHEQDRQKGIVEDYNRDNFDFSQFKGIDWSDPLTYGQPCDDYCIKLTTNPIPAESVIHPIGLTPSNYRSVAIKGDGSCWIRTSIQAALFYAFQDQATFEYFIKMLDQATDAYSHIPGFIGRFKAKQLINLFLALNKLSPQKRLEQFNKKNVDLFLDYSFRSFVHAYENIPGREKELKKILTSLAWWKTPYAYRAIVNYFLPDLPFASYTFFRDRGMTYVKFVKWNSKEYPQVFQSFTYNTESIERYKNYTETFDHYHNIFKERLKTLPPVMAAKKTQGFIATGLLHYLRAESFDKLYQNNAFSAMPVEESPVHVSLIVRADITQQFGFAN
jgi:hypothetical protein